MDENNKKDRLEKFEHFNQFEKLDRKVEETIREVETMDKRKFYKNSFVFAAIWALVLNLIIETLGRFTTAGIFGGLKFMISDPIVFLYNALILFTTLVVASLVKRRVFAFTIISLFWLGIGIVNGVILTQRMTPFTVKDLSNLGDGLTIVTNYLKTWQIVLAAVVVVLAILGLVLLFVKGPKKKDKLHRKSLPCIPVYISFVILGNQHRGCGNFLRESCLRLQGLRGCVLLYEYMAEYRNS